jgi:hypothetical protein
MEIEEQKRRHLAYVVEPCVDLMLDMNRKSEYHMIHILAAGCGISLRDGHPWYHVGPRSILQKHPMRDETPNLQGCR